MHIIEYIKCLFNKHEVFLFKTIKPGRNHGFIKLCIKCEKFFVPTREDIEIFTKEVHKEIEREVNEEIMMNKIKGDT